MSERTIHKPGRRPRRAPFRWTVAALGSLLLAFLSLVWTAPAQAVAPANDAWDSATDVTALPFTATVDTTDATTDAVKPPGADPYVAHSVWFHIRLANDGPLLLSRQGSTYSPMMRLYHATSATQAPDQWTFARDIWGGRLLPNLRGGQHYYLMVATYTSTNSDGSVYTEPGGSLKLHLQRPARASATLARYGVLDRVTGAAVVHGTVQANNAVQVQMYVKLRQLVNGQAVVGWKYKTFDAIAGRTPWKIAILADRSFKLGRARVIANYVNVYQWGVKTSTVHFPTNLVILR